MDAQLRHQALWTRALTLFGSEAKTDGWFRTRLSELGDRTPEEVLEEGSTTEPVEAILDRIEYGVFS